MRRAVALVALGALLVCRPPLRADPGSESLRTHASVARPSAETGASARLRPARPDPILAWLRYKAVRIDSLDEGSPPDDLMPISPWIDDAAIVALGDGTHGTREYYLVKQRIIEFLASSRGSCTVAFEGPWNEFLRIDDYIQGGPGDPDALLRIPGYFFWEYEEMRELLEWARAFNAVRAPAERIELLGLDVYGSVESRDEVLSFLAMVDPAARETAQKEYGCVGELLGGSACAPSLDSVRRNLEEKREQYVASAGLKLYLRALQSARVIEQARDVTQATSFQANQATRDAMMAENARWIQDAWLGGKELVVWAHNEHVGKSPWKLFGQDGEVDVESMGLHLKSTFGTSYFAIGTSMSEGSFIAYNASSSNPVAMQPVTPDNYELLFVRSGHPIQAIPLFGSDVPDWIKGPRRLRFGTASYWPSEFNNPWISLPEKFDAIIHFDHTTPATPLPK
ncbi:MAG: erythromycin esterase family protein [Acidobacteria bacterium]|nr:erythromycin esterase family protein [Acidobacteriota bacterium]